MLHKLLIVTKTSMFAVLSRLLDMTAFLPHNATTLAGLNMVLRTAPSQKITTHATHANANALLDLPKQATGFAILAAIAMIHTLKTLMMILNIESNNKLRKY